jgi:hypothetical protein
MMSVRISAAPLSSRSPSRDNSSGRLKGLAEAT